MDWFTLLAAGYMVYVALIIFLGGTVYRVIGWLKVSRNTNNQDLPNTPGNKGPAFPLQSIAHRGAQFVIIALHVTGLGLFLGHTRIFGDVKLAITILGEDGLNNIGNILGTALGLFLLFVLGFLLLRRLKASRTGYRASADYLLLLLVILLALLGNYLRLTKPFGLEDYRAYVASLVALSPAFPEAIILSPTRWLLTGHVFTANLLLIYFPFSAIIPTICCFISKLVRRNK